MRSVVIMVTMVTVMAIISYTLWEPSKGEFCILILTVKIFTGYIPQKRKDFPDTEELVVAMLIHCMSGQMLSTQ